MCINYIMVARDDNYSNETKQNVNFKYDIRDIRQRAIVMIRR